tara:strand:+ start:2515 stop:2622 length:108 start_codon:yes stop_codon:yes gene_type:complete
MVDFHTALGHDLLEIAAGNGIAEVENTAYKITDLG